MDAERLIQMLRELARATPSFQSEQQFREALAHALTAQGVHNLQTPPYACHRLPNGNQIFPDIVTQEEVPFGIELKHVIVPHEANAPAERFGFPYDIMKDCAKIECLMQASHIGGGAVVGMTDYAPYWTPDFDTSRWWSRNFVLATNHVGWCCVRKRFFEVWRDTQIAGAVFENDRFHIALKRRWEYRWIDYSSVHGRSIRCIVLRPRLLDGWTALDAEAAPSPLTTIPYASPEPREFHRERRDEYRRLRQLLD